MDQSTLFNFSNIISNIFFQTRPDLVNWWMSTCMTLISSTWATSPSCSTTLIPSIYQLSWGDQDLWTSTLGWWSNKMLMPLHSGMLNTFIFTFHSRLPDCPKIEYQYNYIDYMVFLNRLLILPKWLKVDCFGRKKQVAFKSYVANWNNFVFSLFFFFSFNYKIELLSPVLQSVPREWEVL